MFIRPFFTFSFSCWIYTFDLTLFCFLPFFPLPLYMIQRSVSFAGFHLKWKSLYGNVIVCWGHKIWLSLQWHILRLTVCMEKVHIFFWINMANKNVEHQRKRISFPSQTHCSLSSSFIFPGKAMYCHRRKLVGTCRWYHHT